jgi:hypothetical protein
LPGQHGAITPQPRLHWRWNPTPSITNEIVAGQSKFTFNFRNVNEDVAGLVFPNTPVVVGNVYSGAGNLRNVQTWQFVDNLSWIRGSHAFKFGTNLRFVQQNDQRGDIAGFNAAQQVNFERTVSVVDPATFGIPSTIQTANDLPDLQTNINFLLGRVGTTNRGFGSDGQRFVEGPFIFNARYNEYDLYAQDTWKLRRNLTIDLGLRWEIKMGPTEVNNKIRVPNQPMTYGSAPSNSISWVPTDRLFKSDFLNLGPSVGFAWDPFTDGKTSVRGNYRIAYDRMSTFSFSSAVFQSLPG